MPERRRKRFLEISVNGEIHDIAVEPQETLLEVLRNHLGLTGTKDGCGTGECGACTVLLDGTPVLSCLSLALDCQGKAILTIEGLSQGEELTIVQEAFLETGAVQCGFCTPGMVLATTAFLQKYPHPSGHQTKKALEGHLCRCTGYNKIVEAVEKAMSGTGSDKG
jgi:carbon-monoxide dehydrogenase small subunit